MAKEKKIIRARIRSISPESPEAAGIIILEVLVSVKDAEEITIGNKDITINAPEMTE